MKYLIEITKTETGYSAHFPDVPGVFTVGNTLEEVKEHAKEALELHLQGCKEDGIEPPLPLTEGMWVEVA